MESKDAFKYTIYRREEILKLVDNYFTKYPLKSSKADKLKLIKDFYNLELNPKLLEFNLIPSNIKKLKDWIVFKNKWEKLE